MIEKCRETFMDDIEVKHLEKVNPIVQVAIEMGMQIRGNMAPCFRADRHGDGKAPTLFFDVAKNRFLCKECDDVGGGVIEYICQFRHWDRQRAIEWLRHRSDYDLETREKYYHRNNRRRTNAQWRAKE
jgi:hypothetical protein